MYLCMYYLPNCVRMCAMPSLDILCSPVNLNLNLNLTLAIFKVRSPTMNVESDRM